MASLAPAFYSARGNRPRQRLLTIEEFEQFIDVNYVRVLAPDPCHVIPCDCGDINCHGWRFVALEDPACR